MSMSPHWKARILSLLLLVYSMLLLGLEMWRQIRLYKKQTAGKMSSKATMPSMIELII